MEYDEFGVRWINLKEDAYGEYPNLEKCPNFHHTRITQKQIDKLRQDGAVLVHFAGYIYDVSKHAPEAVSE